MNKPKNLWHVAVSVSPEAEEMIFPLLEQFSGQAPSVYSNIETGKTIASIYLEKLAGSRSNFLKQLKLALLPLAEISGHTPKISIRSLPRENWAESWKRHFQPMEFSRRLLVKPSWNKRKPKKNQAVVILDPGLSFGTGQHATTSFCL